jgi:hypothetical protein
VRSRERQPADEQLLQIYSTFAALEQGQQAGAGEGSAAAAAAAAAPRVCFLDTPGPNEAGEEGLRHQVRRPLLAAWLRAQGRACCGPSPLPLPVAHAPGAAPRPPLTPRSRRAQVERLLDSVDAVVYLLDYTKLKTSDEAAIFARLRAINPQLVARLCQRLFYVVNKADEMGCSQVGGGGGAGPSWPADSWGWGWGYSLDVEPFGAGNQQC